jgi:AAA+ superfamily predicted ATPase
MCTNRLGALDPAVKRRAAEILSFDRPSDSQRAAVLGGPLEALGFNRSQVDALVAITGAGSGRHGLTYSDLTQRLLPAIILDAYPSNSVTPARALIIAKQILATPPFEENKR